MSVFSTETIFAPCTAIARTGLSVVRVSGAQAFASLERLTGQPVAKFTARMARLCTLKDAQGQVIDEALVLPFRAPNSFTGEDCVEYHLHGGRAVYQAVHNFLSTQPQHRMAEAGEFTRRAFENGKMDLTQAEAVADLIHAETDLQRQQALGQLQGGLSVFYQKWAADLTKAMAYTEAGIDFADEDLPQEEISAVLAPLLRGLMAELQNHLSDNHKGERLREGIRIAILGAPNAGKSSLLNHLAGRDVAIVTEEAGTTRDVLDVMLDIGGYPVILTDTAGLREAENKVEQEGIRRARNIADNADLKIILFDGTYAPDSAIEKLIDEQSFCLFTKADLPLFKQQKITGNPLYQGVVSTQTGHGVSEFLQKLAEILPDLYQPNAHQPSLTRARHREALTEAYKALERACDAPQIDMMAEDVRLALRHLGRITGHVDVEDLLDIVFRDFCIGK